MLRTLINWLRKLSLRGGNVYCCICEKSYLTFLPSGDDPKAHARCPGCHSIDRHRQLFTLIKPTIASNTSRLNLLHIAPEPALSKRYQLEQNIHYFAIDKFDKGYTYPKNVMPMDLTHLTFDSNFFDIVICSHVLEHIENDQLAIENILRVLKPNGVAYLVVPYFTDLANTYQVAEANTDELRLLHYGQRDHVRKYGLDFADRLSAAGCQVNTIDFKTLYTIPEQIKLGFLNAEIIFAIRKKV